ncbi:MAG: sensor histidine kinase, partial [Bacteroidia bacterium]
MADCYLYLKNTARAEFYINKALEVEKIVSPGSFDNYYYILLERLCLVKGDYKGAYDASATYYSLISKVKELDNSYLSTIYDELAFENKLKQEKLKQDLLKKDAAAKLENAKKVRYSLYAVIIIIMISSIFLVVGLRGYKKLSAKLKVQNKTAELTNKELEKSVSLKEKLIGIIAHDTRSPLAATASALELINMNELDDDEKTMILTALESKTKNALEEADNVIKWAKAQLQGIEIENKVVALKDIVDPAIENIIPRFESKQIKFKSLLTDKCKVYGDPNLLKHVIKNLLVNSGKFSYE